MKVVWTTRAKNNLRAIVTYIGADNPAAARKMGGRFQSLAERLGRQPFIGRPGALPDTREVIPHPSYRMIYQVDDDAVHILAVIHTARQWPPEAEG